MRTMHHQVITGTLEVLRIYLLLSWLWLSILWLWLWLWFLLPLSFFSPCLTPCLFEGACWLLLFIRLIHSDSGGSPNGSLTTAPLSISGMYVCLYECMFGWMDWWMHLWMYVCMYVCFACMYICTYKDTTIDASLDANTLSRSSRINSLIIRDDSRSSGWRSYPLIRSTDSTRTRARARTRASTRTRASSSTRVRTRTRVSTRTRARTRTRAWTRRRLDRCVSWNLPRNVVRCWRDLQQRQQQY